MKRKSIGKLLCLASCLAAFAVLSVPVGRAEDLTLAAKGKTDYQIVIPDSSPSPEIGKRMAEIAQLVQSAFKANGFEITVVSEAKRVPDKPGIYLGDTAFARSNGVNVASFPDWRYVHKVVGRDVIVAGREQPCPIAATPDRPRNAGNGMDRLGTMKAATDFLRQYGGVRFLLPGETGIEFLPTPAITVPANLDVLKIPSLQFKFFSFDNENFYDVANNGFPAVDVDTFPHSWGFLIPQKTYSETHPEYFALISGKRLSSGGQYCISNPDVQELIYKYLLSRIALGYKTVTLGQPDGFQPCQCEPCKKLFATGDDWGDKIWILHRNLAERLLKEQPDIKLMILSYGQTYEPPKSFKDFPPNAVVYLTHYDPGVMKQWKTCNVPGGYIVYPYIFCGGYSPTKTPLFLENEVKFVFELNAKGVILDDFRGNYGLMGPSFYVYGRMFDDPANLQAKDLLEEFYEGAYREAATPMRRFFDTLYHAMQFAGDAKWSYKDVYGKQRSHQGNSMKFMVSTYSPDVLKDLETHLGQAERLAASEKVKRRLALVRLEFDRIRHIATVGHLWNAFRVDPDPAVRERLLQAVDAWNNFLKIMYDDGKGGRLKSGMRRNVIPGWPELMPFLGHSHGAVALTDDTWWDNFANTPLNWNTAEMRKTALAAAQRMGVKPADGAITIDAPVWNTAEVGAFSALPGDSTPVTCKTSIRLLYDKTQVYLRIESELPGTLKNFVPVVKDGQPVQAESLDIAIDPFGTREKFYHFIVGPQAEPRYQAAHGFIAEAVHPLYGKDDPGWQGSWTYETRLEPEKNRWLALLTIPYKTLGVEPPAVGAMWRGNVIRLHVAAPDRLERSAWSATSQNKGGHDQNAFGELVFDDASGSAGAAGKAEASPLRKAREELYRTTFEIKPEWKVLPNLLPASAWGPWRFHEDPADKGMKENWFSKDLGDTGWTKMQVPAFWAETDAGDIQGYGWYRVAFTVPADWKGKTVRLLFGAVDEQAWVYVNGTLAGEHSAASEKVSALQLWDVPFAVEVKPELLTYGGTNVLAVRVHNSAMNGGIWRPVLAQAKEEK